MNNVRPQLEELLFGSVENMSVESVEAADAVVRVKARSTAKRAACPGCGCWSSRIHGSYLHFPSDLPTSGKPVVVSLRVRRFLCAEGSCPRKTFAEQVPGLTCRSARRTERLRSTLVSVGLALAGRAGARMSDAFGVRVSRNTLLRLIQVADRWHLWHNLGEAAEKCVYRHRACLRPAPESPEESTQAPESPASSPWPTGHRFAERTRAKHATVHALLAAGHSKRSIARQLGMGLNTVLRFSRATEPEQLFTGQWQSRPTKLDAYKPYLDQRWQEGSTNAWKLWEEIKAQATQTATATSAPTSAGTCAASPSRSAPGRRPPAPSPAGSSPTPMPWPRATGSSSRPC
ncbi:MULTISPECIES: transposase family protein [Streptomyces]|uniref:transposase family protein n=1 Tax=Streptomyces venezuelae TaxID=54571 RepID=UPI001CC25616|nr:transposase family protein [Streptomyces venezuelae]